MQRKAQNLTPFLSNNESVVRSGYLSAQPCAILGLVYFWNAQNKKFMGHGLVACDCGNGVCGRLQQRFAAQHVSIWGVGFDRRHPHLESIESFGEIKCILSGMAERMPHSETQTNTHFFLPVSRETKQQEIGAHQPKHWLVVLYTQMNKLA